MCLHPDLTTLPATRKKINSIPAKTAGLQDLGVFPSCDSMKQGQFPKRRVLTCSEHPQMGLGPAPKGWLCNLGCLCSSPSSQLRLWLPLLTPFSGPAILQKLVGKALGLLFTHQIQARGTNRTSEWLKHPQNPVVEMVHPLKLLKEQRGAVCFQSSSKKPC